MSDLDASSASPLSKFHANVEKLVNNEPTSKLGQICRRLIDFITPDDLLTDRNQVLSSQIRNASSQAEAILQKMPENLQSSDALKERLSKSDQFQLTDGEGNVVLTHEELKQFCEDMDNLFKKVYPKITVKPFYENKTKMPTLVQEYLSPEIKRLRQEKRADPAKAQDQEHRVQRKIAKGALAIDLGQGIKSNKGATGTLIISDINGKSVGVYKVSEKDVPILTRIKNAVKSFLWGQLSYLSKKNFAQPLAERAAYLLSSTLGFHVAPASALTELNGKTGVFQVFIHRNKKAESGYGAIADVKAATILVTSKEGKRRTIDEKKYVEAKDAVEVDSKEHFTEEEKNKFQQFIIYDYIIGNLDRHDENWFITISENMEMTDIKAIDNANAFPKKQPLKGAIATRNQYQWQTRNIAKEKFTDKSKRFVLENLTPEKIQEFVDKLNYEQPGFLDEDMEMLLKKRARVAQILVQKEGSTPQDLADCVSLQEMEDFLNTMHKVSGF